jgi:hypothetical protein
MSQTARSAGARAVITVALATVALGIAGTSGALAETVQAPSAAAYRDSVGVQTHFDFYGYAYDEEPIATIQSAIRTLGVDHVRDTACLNVDAICAGVRNKLGQLSDAYGATGPKVGVMVLAAPIVDKTNNRAVRDAAIERSLIAIRDSPLASVAEGIEMVNEPDYAGAVWAKETVDDAKTFDRLLAQPQFESIRHIPLIAPALGMQSRTPELVAAGWKTDMADVSNVHAYPATYSTPEATGIATPCDKTQTVLACAGSLAPSPKTLATESGYSTAGTVLVSDWVSQRAQATYTLRLLLNNFNAGVPRTYLYELIDLSGTPIDRNHGYGLMSARVGPNSTVRLGGPKLAYTALSRMQSEIGDLGAAARPGSLDLTITDATTGETLGSDQIQKTVLRRADGTFALALWQPEPAWRHANYKYADLYVPPRPIKVTLDGSQGTWSATRYAPTVSGDPQEHWDATSKIDVAVNDDVTILDLTPPAALRGPVVPPGDEQPGTTVPETSIPGTTLVEAPTPAAGTTTDSAAAQAGVTAPSSDAPRPAAASRTAGQADPTRVRAQADVAREKANRIARARSRAHRAYAACLARQVARAPRRMRQGTALPRPSRPTKEMRARCGRLLGR